MTTTSSTSRRSCADPGAVAHLHRFPRTDGSTVEVAITERVDGDFHIDAPELAARRARVMPGDWSVVRQVHGRTVATADPRHAPEADAVITDETDRPIAVQGADCAPVAFITDAGPIAVAHVGWRGLEAGVIDATIQRLEAGGATAETVLVGPHIGPECYEFGAEDLERLVSTVGPSVRGTTTAGSPALDVGRGIAEILGTRHGITDVRMTGDCTGCGNGGWSHRVRQEPQRHALVASITREPNDA